MITVIKIAFIIIALLSPCIIGTLLPLAGEPYANFYYIVIGAIIGAPAITLGGLYVTALTRASRHPLRWSISGYYLSAIMVNVILYIGLKLF